LGGSVELAFQAAGLVYAVLGLGEVVVAVPAAQLSGHSTPDVFMINLEVNLCRYVGALALEWSI
jgi:hypothetical protein